MRESDAFVFLLSLAVLLTGARLLGELARRVGFPLVVGEIGAGILLGPTVFGRIASGAHKWLFTSGAPQTMLGGYTTVAVVLLLAVAGLEVDLAVVVRHRKTAAATSILGILMPLAGGLLLGFLIPDSDLARPDQRVLFAVFLGVALSISALPVIAKTLLDLGLFKTDIGLLVMASAMVNDVVGWLCFSVLVEPMRGGAVALGGVAKTIGLTTAFVVVCIAVGRPVFDRVLGALQKGGDSERRVLSLVVLLALFGAAFTQAVGIHAVFGGFVVGVMVGASPRLREHTRVIIHEFVTTIFAPVFFASLGLRVDFFAAFDLRLCVLVFGIATITKVVGCTLGCRMARVPWRASAAVGFGLNARGAMEIILALLALDAGLIKTSVFVALVIMALGTSLLSGPLMKVFLRQREPESFAALLRAGGFIPSLSATTPDESITELVGAVAHLLGERAEAARRAVSDRERAASTGLGDHVALPHAAVEGISRPIVALGRSATGIDFDAPDGAPAHIVVLLLMPPGAQEREVRVLAAVARALLSADARQRILGAPSLRDVLDVVEAIERDPAVRQPRGASLADI